MSKTRLREVQVGNTSVWWALPSHGVGRSWRSNPAWLDPQRTSSHHNSECHVRIGFFLLWKQHVLKVREGQPNSSMGPGRGKSWVWQNGRVSLSRGKTPPTLFGFSLRGPNWTEANCPVCCQKHPPWLQRVAAPEGETPGAPREMEAEPLGLPSAASVSRGWSRCLSSQLTCLWICGASPPPAFPSAQTDPRPDFCLKWTCYSSHGGRCRGGAAGLEEAAPCGARPPKPQAAAGAFSRSRGDNGILDFSTGVLRPPRDLN